MTSGGGRDAYEAARAIVLARLPGWETGALDASAVHERAEVLDEVAGRDRDAGRPWGSALEALLAQRSILNAQLLVEEDIPATRRLLAAPHAERSQALESWAHYPATRGYEARRRRLASRPYCLA